jgi:hypothetical protein
VDVTRRWETEALRAGRRPSVSQKQSDRHPRWVTLREAAEATGVPIGTIRSWSKTDAVDTYLELDGESALRMVDLEGVRARARGLGRPPVEDADAEMPDLGAPTTGQTMIVPIDAWNKMLAQLGNLHEAGQQLAEARERAARAETEASFLKEQLRELRRRDPEPPPVPEVPPPPPPTLPAAAESPAPPSGRTSFLRYLYRGWRSRH